MAPDLWVCPTSTGITATDCGGGNPYLSNATVAVIYSLGPNWATGGITADEAANLNNDQVFIYHNRTSNPQFDDIATWLSSGVLYSRMVNAGRLP